MMNVALLRYVGDINQKQKIENGFEMDFIVCALIALDVVVLM